MMTVDNRSNTCVDEKSAVFEALGVLQALEALKFWAMIRQKFTWYYNRKMEKLRIFVKSARTQDMTVPNSYYFQ
jgi:hypothetical protein